MKIRFTVDLMCVWIGHPIPGSQNPEKVSECQGPGLAQASLPYRDFVICRLSRSHKSKHSKLQGLSRGCPGMIPRGSKHRPVDCIHTQHAAGQIQDFSKMFPHVQIKQRRRAWSVTSVYTPVTSKTRSLHHGDARLNVRVSRDITHGRVDSRHPASMTTSKCKVWPAW